MGFLQTSRIALRSLLTHPLRSILAVLGIVIGVAAVILMTGMGAGAQERVERSVFAMGTNLLYCWPESRGSGHSRARTTVSQTLTVEDAEAVARLPKVREVSPEYGRSYQLKYANRNVGASVEGVTPTYESIRNYRVVRGRFITRQDLLGKRRVCVLGSQLTTDLFGPVPPVGKWVKIDRQNFQVVGVMEEKGAQGWSNPDAQAYVPLTTATSRLARVEYIGRLVIAAEDMPSMTAVQEHAEALLRRRHKVPDDEPSDFQIRSQTEWLQRYTEVAGTFGALLAGIASVSLLVGGIGIMNIMLVSVTERTREIGIRKAIGARRRDILRQFLVESMTISVLGGLIGVGLAVSAGPLVQRLSFWESLSRAQPGRGDWAFVYSPSIMILAFAFSAGVGVFFGLYPAFKASRLSPVEALRYE